MKQNPAERATRQRMAPGALSRDGFLGPDTRTLADIVAADLAELDVAGLTPADIADALDTLHAAADRGLETPQTLCDGALTVQLNEGMGRMPCPFADGFRDHKAVITITAGDRTIRITPLHSHLIRQHGFFQGRGAVFRLEPADAIHLCQILRDG